MIDVQLLKDHRRIRLDKVGVKGITYPVVVLDKENRTQSTVATVNMYVDLPHHFKGAHMSRFVEVLNRHRGEMTLYKMPDVLREMRQRLGAEKAHLELEFPYFIEKKAPVSGAISLMDYLCRFIGAIDHEMDFVLSVRVPVTSLCPCSREISRFGAHNQRSHVTVAVRSTGFIWIEELVELVEASASCELYSLLKREDEKFVTEKAYENPVFVEDLVRNVAIRLQEEERVFWYSIEAENFESIHNHSAYAFLEMDKRTQ